MKPKLQAIPMRSLDLNITERLHERVLTAAAYEGVTIDAFLEHALVAAAVETERRLFRDASNRDPNEYPHKCDYCEDRFKLPMHRARHVTWSHPDMVPKKEQVVGPTAEAVIQVVVQAIKEVATTETADPRFKLDPDIDQDLLDEFDQRYYDDVPRLD